jgi:uncharacterized protein
VISFTRSIYAVSVLLVCSLSTRAEPISSLRPTGYVNDFAHVLTPDTVTRLENLCAEVDQKAHAQIAVVTVNSLDGLDIETYSVELFKKWGIGSKASDRGVLILYGIRDRRSRIEVGYGLEPILPDGKVGSFQREAAPLLRNGDYSGAISLVANRVADVVAQDAGVQLTNAQPRAPTGPAEAPSQGISMGGILLLVIVVLLFLFTPLRGLLFWMFLSGMSGGSRRSGGGWGGGGFGGGGFGGFGGGSSGGGGASGSW